VSSKVVVLGVSGVSSLSHLDLLPRPAVTFVVPPGG
jgi:hypothetical protein